VVIWIESLVVEEHKYRIVGYRGGMKNANQIVSCASKCLWMLACNRYVGQDADKFENLRQVH